MFTWRMIASAFVTFMKRGYVVLKLLMVGAKKFFTRLMSFVDYDFFEGVIVLLLFYLLFFNLYQQPST